MNMNKPSIAVVSKPFEPLEASATFSLHLSSRTQFAKLKKLSTNIKFNVKTLKIKFNSVFKYTKIKSRYWDAKPAS